MRYAMQYKKHAEEAKMSIPEIPTLFLYVLRLSLQLQVNRLANNKQEARHLPR